MPNLARTRKIDTAADAVEAREQAEAYYSLFAPQDLELDDGTVLKVPPHPDLGMLDDEQMAAYEELRFETESYDREPDVIIPAHTLNSGTEMPEETIQGALKIPFRKDGVLIKPPHSVRVVAAALGEADYKRLREGGRSAGDVWRLWGRQSYEINQRRQRDSKSVAGSVDLAAVPEADST